MTEAPASAPRRLRVGSWPGREAAHNRFLPILLDALEAEGCEIVDMPEVRSIRPEAVDVLLLHWAERVFWEADGAAGAMATMARLLWRLARRPRRVRVVWIAHNLAPHERRGRFKRWATGPFLAAFARLLDGALALSPGTAPVVAAALPRRGPKVGHFWHPAYDGERLDPAARAAARAAFGWDHGAVVVGYCGQVRAYKGLEELVAAFEATGDPRLRLLVAGLPADAGLAARLQTAAARDPRVALRLGDLPAAAFREALGACDLFAAPFARYLHSGSLIHALSAGCPVLTPATPFSRSLRDATSAEWVRLHDGPLDRDVLAAAARPRPDAAPPLAAFAPDEAARRILAFAESLGDAPASPR